MAIVIPAYKSDFFKQTLESIVNQSNKNFNLYIGNDAGSEEIDLIVSDYTDYPNIFYKRFDENLGSSNLVNQWGRCIELARNEEFLWLFPDDDVMPADAVDRFYKTYLQWNNYDVYRFGIQFIDGENKIIRETEELPPVQNVKSFLEKRLSFQTISSVAEYIFSRRAYEQNNGFVNFPLAWCSDDASWIAFSKHEGIRSIQGKPISVRMVEGKNISCQTSNNKIKFIAVIKYLNWLKKGNFLPVRSKSLGAKYLISNVNYLKIPFKHRLLTCRKILELVGPLSTLLIILNKGKLYSIMGYK